MWDSLGFVPIFFRVDELVTLRVGMIAGEPSGDRLGAELVAGLRELRPDVEVSGIAGPAMRAAGCEALLDSDEIAVMGLVEVLKHYPRLRRLQRRIIRHFVEDPPDLFVGIDAPDFNLPVEEQCRLVGIPSVHYVSPTVWAWREGRIKRITRATDLVLTIFPFEEDYYRQFGIPAVFVGHPLADATPDHTDRHAARERLGIAEWRPVLALLPGSRSGEMHRHANTFLETAEICQREFPDLQCVVPVVDEKRERELRAVLARREANREVSGGALVSPLIIQKGTTEVLSAADVVLTASGTAAVETMLHRRPMVVAYKVAWVSYWIIRAALKIPYISMPNVLAGRMLVPEFVQGAMKAQDMAQQLLMWLREPASAEPLLREFARLHQTLRRGSGRGAAQTVLELVSN